MKKFNPTLNTVFTDDGKPVIAPMGQPSGAIIESIGENLNVMTLGDGTFSGTKIPGQGVFAKMLMDEGVRVLDAGELPKIILKNEDGKCQSD